MAAANVLNVQGRLASRGVGRRVEEAVHVDDLRGAAGARRVQRRGGRGAGVCRVEGHEGVLCRLAEVVVVVVVRPVRARHHGMHDGGRRLHQHRGGLRRRTTTTEAMADALRSACVGVCDHGDAELDEDNNPHTYDGAECWCRPCGNFYLCKTWAPKAVCTGCALDYGRQPLEALGVIFCCVCLADAGGVKHPAGCGHEICAACLWQTTCQRTDTPQPADYGFVRLCGCDGEPAVWGTAECGVCAEELMRFEATEAGAMWVDACADAEAEGGVPCPLCRKRAT